LRNSFAFAQDVSVVTSWITPDGRYPLPFSPILLGAVFGLSSPGLSTKSDHPIRKLYNSSIKIKKKQANKKSPEILETFCFFILNHLTSSPGAS
jgi:hypothetical protein